LESLCGENGTHQLNPEYAQIFLSHAPTMIT